MADSNRPQTDRDAKGRFRSGNRASTGRPPGRTARALLLARQGAEDVLPLLIQAAKDGDMDAIKTLLSFGLPRLKAVSLPEAMPPDVAGLLEALSTGQVAVDAAKEALECRLLARKIVESEELEQRIEALEQQVRKP